MPRLGLIVVDEEHDPSYKQQEGARYSARDLAVYRGKLEKRDVLLGSATPSLESWQRANEGRYLRLALPSRIGGGALPTVRLVDMNQQPKQRGANTALSPPLVDAIQQRIARGEQSLVFLNRRGYAPVLHCADCGWKSGCPHCSAWRVFHKLDRTLRCHHCGLTERVPRACPDCGNLDIAPIGRGTERLGRTARGVAAHAGRQRRRASPASTPTARGSRARSKPSSARCTPATSTCWSARRWSPRATTSAASRWSRRSTRTARCSAATSARPERLFALLMQAGGRAGRDAAQARAQRDVGADLAPAARALRRAAAARFRGLRRQPAEGARDGRPAAVVAPRDPARRCAHARGGARLPAGRGRTRADAARRRPGDGLPAGAAGRSRASPTSSACRCWSNRRRARRCSASSRSGCRRCTSCGAAARAPTSASCAGPSTSTRQRLPASVSAASGRVTSASSSVARTSPSTASARSAGGSSDSISASSSSASSRSSGARWR